MPIGKLAGGGMAGLGGFLAAKGAGRQKTTTTFNRESTPTFAGPGNELISSLQRGPQFDRGSTDFLQSFLGDSSQPSAHAQGQMDAQRGFFDDALTRTLSQTQSGEMRRSPVGARQILTSQLTGDLGREHAGQLAAIGQMDADRRLGVAGQLDERALQSQGQLTQLLSLLRGEKTSGKETTRGPRVGTTEAIGRGLMAGGQAMSG